MDAPRLNLKTVKSTGEQLKMTRWRGMGLLSTQMEGDSKVNSMRLLDMAMGFTERLMGMSITDSGNRARKKELDISGQLAMGMKHMGSGKMT